MNAQQFVPAAIEQFLARNGWVKVSDHPLEKVVNPYIGDYTCGMQVWQKHVEDAPCDLYISYDSDGKGRHKCELYRFGDDAEVFKLRVIRSELRKRSLAK